MSHTFVSVFYNGKEDHHFRRTLTLSNSAMSTFTSAKSLRAPYRSICSLQKDESLLYMAQVALLVRVTFIAYIGPFSPYFWLILQRLHFSYLILVNISHNNEL